MPARRAPFVCALLLAGPAAYAQSPESLTRPYALPGRSTVVADQVSGPPPAAGTAPYLDGQRVRPAGGPASTPAPAVSIVYETGQTPAPCGDGIYSSDHASLQVLFGGYSSGRPGPRDFTFTYLPLTLRAGWTPGPMEGRETWQGNFEYLAELMAAPIVSDFGSYFLSPACVVRYNFARADAGFVPYAQFGLGVVFNDAYKDKEQHAIGALTEFIAHAEIGARYFVSENWSLDIEGGMTHISNSSTAGRNYGINAYGGSIGFTYYFPTGR
jgi:lipid A 3-O-deacylase